MTTRRVVLARMVVGLTVLVGMSGVMAAQTAPADTNPGKWIMPGDSLLRGARVSIGTFHYLLTAYKDGDEFNVGRIQDQISVDTVDGAPRLVRVQRLERGTQRLIDSTWTDFATLMPKRHRSEQPQRRIGIDFIGKKIKATIGQPGAVPAVIDTTLKLAVFDSGNWDLLLRALPLEQGLRVRFLVYDTDAGVHEYRLAVTGTTTAVYLPTPRPTVVVYDETATKISETPLRIAPALGGGMPVLTRAGDLLTWWTGSAVMVFSDKLDYLYTIDPTGSRAPLGPATVMATKLLVPVADGLAVYDKANGAFDKQVALTHPAGEGPVVPAVCGSMVIEQRGPTLAGFAPG